MREGVRRKQEAEIIRTEWMGNGKKGKNGKAQEERKEANESDRQSLSPRQPSESQFDAGKPGGA